MMGARIAPRPAGIRVEFHSGYAGLQGLRESWNRMLRGLARPRFFQEWGWYEAYLKHLGGAAGNVWFALPTDGASPIAIVPLQRVAIGFQGLSSKLWRLPEDDPLPLADIIAADGVAGGEVVAALLDGLQRQGMQWDRMQFTGFGDDSCLKGLVLPPAYVTRQDVLNTCDEVICDRPWDDFARGFAPNFRSNLNKARHKVDPDTSDRCVLSPAVTIRQARAGREPDRKQGADDGKSGSNGRGGLPGG